MAETEIPDSIRKFILAHIDSAELLDVLSLIDAGRIERWSSERISTELRANAKSIEGRLGRLEQLGILEREGKEFLYRPKSPELAKIAEELVRLYGTMKHRVLGLVFSPLRQMQSIANAFIFSKKEGDGENGD